MRLFLPFFLLVSAAFSCSRVGSFAQPTSNGSQAVTFGTGTACVAKVVFFWHNNRTSDGDSAGLGQGFGMATSSSARFATFSFGADNAATSDEGRIVSTALAIVTSNAAQTTLAAADFTSFDSDGFTVNWTTTDANARIINYLAIGGSDVTNVFQSTFTGSGSPQSITGVGFQPDLVVFVAATSTNVNSLFNFGMATASAAWSTSFSAQDGLSTMNTRRLQRNNKSFNALSGAGATVTECTTAMTSDGFDQTCPTQGNLVTYYVAIKGGSYKLGSYNAPTSDGNSAQTGVGFQPKSLLIASYGTTAQTTAQTNAAMSFGAATTASNRWAIWTGATDNVPDSINSSTLDRTKIIRQLTPGGATPTALANADFVSFESDGFTLNWDADATARQILYLAISTSEGAAPGGGGSTKRRIITWQ